MLKPLDLLEDIRKVLAPVYGEGKVQIGRRSVGVDLSIGSEEEDKVLSFDVVPAFESGNHYQIPDNVLKDWVKTDPNIHAEIRPELPAAAAPRQTCRQQPRAP